MFNSIVALLLIPLFVTAYAQDDDEEVAVLEDEEMLDMGLDAEDEALIDEELGTEDSTQLEEDPAADSGGDNLPGDTDNFQEIPE